MRGYFVLQTVGKGTILIPMGSSLHQCVRKPHVHKLKWPICRAKFRPKVSSNFVKSKLTLFS